jgi:hypothetical protein
VIIVDGTGTGNQAKIDTRNRLQVHAVTEPEGLAANRLGSAYNMNTGELTLTSANESAVLYFKNNESKDYIMEAIAVGLGPSTGGASTDIPLIKIIRNPTAGTIVDDASNVSINTNRNFGSSNTVSADVYKGAEAKTLTDGDDHLFFYQPANGRLLAEINVVIPKGKSIGVKITPQASNTSMTCYVALIGYLDQE